MRGRVAIFPLIVLGLGALEGCYDIGDGTAPPRNTFYFPVGLQVSNGGTVLYAANSDFDLQFNGGTLQSYDLRQIRQDALLAIQDPATPALPFAPGRPKPGEGDCPANPRVTIPGTDIREPLGETCAPPVDSTFYFRDSAVIGAFATGLLLSAPPANIPSLAPKVHADDPAGTLPAPRSFDRLFAAVRGNATVTWATIVRDGFDLAPDKTSTRDNYAPFRIDCGQDSEGRCDAAHEVGADVNEPGDTRHITLPGEPFGFSFSQDGTTIAITHQNDPDTTLVTTGLGRDVDDNHAPPPAIQFVLDRLPLGGMGVAPIPHDPDAYLGVGGLPRGAFLETNRTAAEVSLLRQYPDDGEGGLPPSIPRPFLDLEANFPIAVTTSGTDSRGIVVDPSPRIACKARVLPVGPGRTQADRDRDVMACARKPARAFIANRTPPALLVGDVGTTEGIDGSYDPDRLIIHTSIPLSAGPANVYLAPVVDRDGAYSLRVWVVCFDSATIYVYDPDAGVLDNVIRVGVGPFAMAFDPFTLEDVATHAQVPIDERDAKIGLRRYRFAYVGSFTQSYVQLIDLDNATPNPFTYERIVYTLGVPTNPKGT